MSDRKSARLAGIAAAIALLFATGGASADPNGYRFEIVGPPTSASQALTIRLIDASTGQRVPNAQLFHVNLGFAVSKGNPEGHYTLTPLQSDGHGNFIYPSDPNNPFYPGEFVRLGAHIDDQTDLVRGTVTIGRGL